MFSKFACFLFLILINGCLSKRKAQGKISYEFQFGGNYVGCDDQGEDIFNYTNIKVLVESSISTLMGGSFSLKKPFTFGTQVSYETYKLTENGEELSWTMDLPDFCELVEQKNMPWSPVFDAMNLKERRCPIPAGEYSLEPGVKMDMSFLQSTLSKDSLGEYNVHLEIHKLSGLPPKKVRLACFSCGYSIIESRQQIDDEE